MLRQNPGFSAAALLALALGIGATTAIFSVVNGVILRPLPYPDPDRLVQLFETEPELPTVPVNMADYLDWKKQAHSFQSLAMYQSGVANLNGTGEPERVRYMVAEATLFPMIGVTPALGRAFTAEENQPGHEHEVMLSYGFWKARFGGGRRVLGEKLNFDNELYTIVGVLPREFQGQLPFAPLTVDVWAPVSFDLTQGNNQRGNHGLNVLGRLAKGATLEQANAELKSLASVLEKQFPRENFGVGAIAFNLKELTLKKIRPALWVLFCAVGCVLLIACANVANLLLARSSARQKEIAVRMAVGAGRKDVIRQLLTESVLMALLAGLLGLLLANWSVDIVRGVRRTGIPRISEVVIDANVLWFALGISVITAILFGIAPALRISGLSLSGTMRRTSGRTTETAAQRRVRLLLVAGEVCLATVLLVGSGLLIRSFLSVTGIDPGFRADHVLTMSVNLSSPRYEKQPPRTSFYDEILAQVRSLPGISSASISSKIPLLGGNNGPILIEGQPRPQKIWESPLVEYTRVSPDFFRTFGVRVLAGRDFEPRDQAGAESAIVNESFVKKFWKGQGSDAIGKRISYFQDSPQWMTIVGVVNDVRQFGLEAKPIPEMYRPIHREAVRNVVLSARTNGDPLLLAKSVRERVRAIDPELPVFNVDSMEQVTAKDLGFRTFNTSLLLAFAGVAMILAAIGIYGVISYSVSQRVPEIGVRMALGAPRADVVRMILRQGMTPAIAGALAGIVASLGVTRLLSTMLYGVKPTDAITLAAVAAVLLLVALVASYVPARRAASVDPITALRYE